MAEIKRESKMAKLSELTEYENNPRDNSKAVAKVAASITDFGFLSPIVTDERLEILAGHTRYAAAKKLHLEEVPVVIVSGLSENQKKAFRIADNKAAEFSDWNLEALFKEVAEIEWADFSPEAWGLNLKELEQSAADSEQWQELLNSAEETVADNFQEGNDAPARYVVRLQGEPELFTDELRDVVEKFRAAGGNVGGMWGKT